MNIVVQKYGGTSVSTAEGRSRLALNVMQAVNNGKQVIVVVSAMGRKGDPYATDTLIDVYRQARIGVNKRDLDLIMSCGETISAAVVSATIQGVGGKSIALTGRQAGLQTDELYGNATVQKINTDILKKHLEKGEIPVVTSFQGCSQKGDVTTLGRGGSDTTAVLLGEALDAKAIEIYTDVDGVMTADPRIVSKAKVIKTLGYEECYQMSVDGAKVVDHKAVEVARRSRKTLIIKNTFKDGSGTVIQENDKCTKREMEPRIITAVTGKKDVSQFKIEASGLDERIGRLLLKMEEENVSLDLINFFETQQVFTVSQEDVDKVKNILEILKLKYEFRSDCCKLTAIGYKIHGVPGVMKRIVLALSKNNIEILQSGDSHTTISCLVAQSSLEMAMCALHEEFKLHC